MFLPVSPVRPSSRKDSLCLSGIFFLVFVPESWFLHPIHGVLTPYLRQRLQLLPDLEALPLPLEHVIQLRNLRQVEGRLRPPLALRPATVSVPREWPAV